MYATGKMPWTVWESRSNPPRNQPMLNSGLHISADRKSYVELSK
jgi:hypothetical protein